ncbi:MAG: dTDP-glucose 4,6-dehydratase [Chlamydiales bacterium]|nr:dTDP-glucose 4,6-dehydratase [Chlamydiales bacterium]
MRRREFATAASALGFWLIASSTVFNLPDSKTWFSDLLSGILLIFFSLYSLRKKSAWPLWVVTTIGLWIQFAPLALWADQTWQYLNGTLCGFIAMMLSLRALYPKEITGQPDIAPTGWSFNPSSWGPRIVMAFFALSCAFLAHYMAAFQLGFISSIWDPIFGDGTYKVVTSDVSKAFPVSDAGLGALAYTIEALTCCQGDNQRWRSMPWAAVTFGLLAVPVSIVSILLIISQPVIVGAWCSWCLLIALLMVLMIPVALSEFVASIRFLHQSYRKKKPLWHLFWQGEHTHEKVITAVFKRQKTSFPPAGITLPWNLIASALLGLWTVFSIHFFVGVGIVADSAYVAGPLIYTIAIIAMAEVVRAARFVNILLGLGLIATVWFAEGASSLLLVHQTLLGIALILLSLRRGPIRQRYGTWDRFIF